MREIERHIGGPALACMRGSLLWPSTLLEGVSIQKTTVGPQAATWGSISVLRFEVRRPQARFAEGLHRTRHFHLAVLNRPIGESLADYEPLVLWKGINSVEQALPLQPLENNRESYSRSKRKQD